MLKGMSIYSQTQTNKFQNYESTYIFNGKVRTCLMSAGHTFHLIKTDSPPVDPIALVTHSSLKSISRRLSA